MKKRELLKRVEHGGVARRRRAIRSGSVTLAAAGE